MTANSKPILNEVASFFLETIKEWEAKTPLSVYTERIHFVYGYGYITIMLISIDSDIDLDELYLKRGCFYELVMVNASDFSFRIKPYDIYFNIDNSNHATTNMVSVRKFDD